MKLISLFLLLTIHLSAKDYGSIVISEVTSIYDGDTFTVNIKDYPPIVGNRISIRVNGIDTPEMRGKCHKEKALARLAKQFTVAQLRSTEVIELRNIQRGKYFRIVADVYVDGNSLTKGLIEAQLGVKYDGGKKAKDWCE